ncbi:MAG: outer membrane protein assembly factor BamE [Alcanivorax sediminis]|uniref:Outer membrane protein assembly factor BamE n=1 Tax=Alcanivorax sediminis TaxID=2663008 RepID=A0A6N7LNQ8_9GAMM|nr:outer membrane protein assembly factor BamE [Alcanivorax sediminis]MQX51678.1 outer membrane protein assembly factor BamE [Alcanivorax sediminis]
MPRITTLLLLSTLMVLGGCSSLRFPGVYRIDIPQGNFVTEDMLSKLQPGMSPEQVRFALGAPTLIDPFTPNVWFYPMTYRPGKGDKVSQKIAVYFDGGVYSRYEGEVVDDFKAKTSGRNDRELQQKAEERQEGSD